MSGRAALQSFDTIDTGFAPKLTEHIAPINYGEIRALLDQKTGRAVAVTPSALITTQFMDGTTSIVDLADDVAAVFGADASSIADELISFARDLARKQMLENASGVPASTLDPGDEERDDCDDDEPELIPVPEVDPFDAPGYLNVAPNG